MIKKFIFFVVPALLTLIYLSGFVGYSLKENQLQECADEIARKCPRLTSYAIALEDENARINTILNDCEIE